MAEKTRSRKVKENSLKVKRQIPKFKINNKITHVFLHDRHIKKINLNSQKFSNLQVLYLHNNDIREIENIGHLTNLTSLYLQKNKIANIKGLDNLKNLRKLYLGHNQISVVEKMENLQNLEEFHVEKQTLPDGNCLCFDPRAIQSISETLVVLNVSCNKIQSLRYFSPLIFLKVLDASHNHLEDVDEVCETLKSWFYLRDASFFGNPIAKKHHYQENIVANTYNLQILDRRSLSESTSEFFKKLHQEKLKNRESKKSINLAEQFKDFPAKNYPMSLQKAVSASILKERKNSQSSDLSVFNEENAVFLPWKKMTPSGTFNNPTRVKSLLKNRKNTTEPSRTVLFNEFSKLKI